MVYYLLILLVKVKAWQKLFKGEEDFFWFWNYCCKAKLYCESLITKKSVYFVYLLKNHHETANWVLETKYGLIITRKHYLFVLDLQKWKILIMCPAHCSSAKKHAQLQASKSSYFIFLISSGWPDSHACCNILWQCNIGADSSSTWWLPWYNQCGKFFFLL